MIHWNTGSKAESIKNDLVKLQKDFTNDEFLDLITMAFVVKDADNEWLLKQDADKVVTK